MTRCASCDLHKEHYFFFPLLPLLSQFPPRLFVSMLPILSGSRSLPDPLFVHSNQHASRCFAEMINFAVRKDHDADVVLPEFGDLSKLPALFHLDLDCDIHTLRTGWSDLSN
jgi:hypothetical protein